MSRIFISAGSVAAQTTFSKYQVKALNTLKGTALKIFRGTGRLPSRCPIVKYLMTTLANHKRENKMTDLMMVLFDHH